MLSRNTRQLDRRHPRRHKHGARFSELNRRHPNHRHFFGRDWITASDSAVNRSRLLQPFASFVTNNELTCGRHNRVRRVEWHQMTAVGDNRLITACRQPRQLGVKLKPRAMIFICFRTAAREPTRGEHNQRKVAEVPCLARLLGAASKPFGCAGLHRFRKLQVAESLPTPVDEAMIREAAVKMNRGAKVRRTTAQRTPQSDQSLADR